MIVGEPYQRDGRTLLRNLRESSTVPPGYVDTGLSAMPTSTEKPAWDGSRVVPIVLTEGEKLDRLALSPRVLAALVARSAPSATAAQRAWAGQILDAALAQIEAARK